MGSKPKANPKDVQLLDANIQSELKLAVMTEKIDREDALYLLIVRLPEWGSRQFVMDMVKASFDTHEERKAAKKGKKS